MFQFVSNFNFQLVQILNALCRSFIQEYKLKVCLLSVLVLLCSCCCNRKGNNVVVIAGGAASHHVCAVVKLINRFLCVCFSLPLFLCVSVLKKEEDSGHELNGSWMCASTQPAEGHLCTDRVCCCKAVTHTHNHHR